MPQQELPFGEEGSGVCKGEVCFWGNGGLPASERHFDVWSAHPVVRVGWKPSGGFLFPTEK